MMRGLLTEKQIADEQLASVRGGAGETMANVNADSIKTPIGA